MINVSDEYRALMKRNFRPKCVPQIQYSYTENENKVNGIMTSPVKEISFSQYEDPMSIEIPYVEATIKTKELDEAAFKTLADTLIKKKADITITFMQNLGFRSSWKSIHETGKKWSGLYEQTWKNIYRDILYEKIQLPSLKIISVSRDDESAVSTWKLRKHPDLYSNEKQNYLINSSYDPKPENQTLLNIAKSGLYIGSGIEYATGAEVKNDIFPTLYISGRTIDLLSGLCAAVNSYISVANDNVQIKDIGAIDIDGAVDIPKRCIYNRIRRSYCPKIGSVRQYSYSSFADYENPLKCKLILERHTEEWVNADAVYPEISTASPSGYVGTILRPQLEPSMYEDEFDSWNELPDKTGLIGTSTNETIVGNTIYVFVNPIFTTSAISNTSYIGGVVYEENNMCNSFPVDSTRCTDRADYVVEYNNPNLAIVEFEIAGDASLQSGDVILIPANNGTGSEPAVIIGIEHSYNGTLRSKIKAKEIATNAN